MSKHATELVYYDTVLDDDKLVSIITSLRYDSLALFLDRLAEGIRRDAQKDRKAGRELLATTLSEVAFDIEQASDSCRQAWEICEPHMKENE